MAKEILLGCGSKVLVDDDKYEELVKFAWRLNRHGCPVRATTVDGKKGTTILMHRVVIGAPKGSIVDHINGNNLDARLENLRFANSFQNGANMRKSQKKVTSSKFKGVTWKSSGKKWQSQIVGDGKRFYLGLYTCEHEAAHAYNKKSIELHGDFAVLNPVGF